MADTFSFDEPSTTMAMSTAKAAAVMHSSEKYRFIVGLKSARLTIVVVLATEVVLDRANGGQAFWDRDNRGHPPPLGQRRPKANGCMGLSALVHRRGRRSYIADGMQGSYDRIKAGAERGQQSGAMIIRIALAGSPTESCTIRFFRASPVGPGPRETRCARVVADQLGIMLGFRFFDLPKASLRFHGLPCELNRLTPPPPAKSRSTGRPRPPRARISSA
jgi:hypothetical protein